MNASVGPLPPLLDEEPPEPSDWLPALDDAPVEVPVEIPVEEAVVVEVVEAAVVVVVVEVDVDEPPSASVSRSAATFNPAVTIAGVAGATPKLEITCCPAVPSA